MWHPVIHNEQARELALLGGHQLGDDTPRSLGKRHPFAVVADAINIVPPQACAVRNPSSCAKVAKELFVSCSRVGLELPGSARHRRNSERRSRRSRSAVSGRPLVVEQNTHVGDALTMLAANRLPLFPAQRAIDKSRHASLVFGQASMTIERVSVIDRCLDTPTPN